MPTSTLARARAYLADLLAIRGDTETQSHNFRNMLVSGIWFGPVDGGIFNFLPVFMARLGASPSLVSLLTSAPSIVGIFSYIPGGAYVERQRNLLGVFLRMGMVARLSFPLIALLPFLVPPAALPMAIVIVWGLTAIPQAIHVPAWTAVMRLTIPVEKRAKLNGTRWAIMSLASGAAILTFGWLLDHTPFPVGYQIVFIASFIAGALNIYYFSRLRLPPTPPAAPRVAGQPAGERLRDFLQPLLSSRPFVRYNIVNLGYRLTLALPMGLYSVFWVNELHASDTWIGLRGTAGYATLVIGYFFWGRVANRIGHRTLMYICGAGLAFYPVLTALAPTVEWLLPAALLWGLTVGGIDIGLFDLLLATCPEGRQPSAAAVSQVLASVAISVGPLLGAGLAALLDIRSALLLIGAAQLVAVGLFWLLPGREQEGLTHPSTT